jgi:hypothetical protein
MEVKGDFLSENQKFLDGKLFMARFLVVQFLLIGTFLSRPNGRFVAKVMKISDI